MRTILLGLLLSGCGGGVPDGEIDSAWRLPPPILYAATPLVTWQMNSCITDDQRAGLIAAVKQAAARNPQTSLQNAVGDSRCIATEERGALFGQYDRGNRGLALSNIAIRPSARPFAFGTMTPLIDTAASVEWSWRNNSVKRFDDAGTFTPTGRYEITGYDNPIDRRPKTILHVVDHTNNHTVDVTSSLYLEVLQGALNCTYPWPQPLLSVSPPVSSNPLVQTIINATNNALPYINDHLMPAAPCFAMAAIDVASQPSLKGWPLQFEDLYVDADGNEIGVGGPLLIQ
jgi:hypothetical protein